ncbi:MAG: class I SAM-dependent methyltransferase [bacterium]|nr:class I SAM-dependent methyltransferase [bacterium]
MLNDEKIKDYYRYVENYDWTHVSDIFVGPETLLHRNRSKKIIKLINQHLMENGKFLDIGCGTGLITRHLPPGSTGLDINPRNLEKAKKYAPQINFVEGDAEKTKFPNETFDLIVCTEVLEHFLDPSKTLREIKRILKPEGIFIGSVPSKGLLWKLRFLSRTCGTKEPYHKHYLKTEITNLLKNSFKETTIIGDTIKMNWFFVCRNKIN